MTERVLLEPHAHTKETSQCGELSAAELIALLHARGYGAVVITDHYVTGERNDRESRNAFLDGWRAARQAAEACGVVVLPGMEIRFGDRPEDYLVYGMEEEDFENLPDNACEMGLSEFYNYASEKGWRIYQAHPFRPRQLPANPSFLHGMEVFNGNPRQNSQNRRAAQFAMLHNLSTIAGSDVHEAGDVGVVGLLAPQEALTPQGFAAWLASTSHPRIEYQSLPVDGIRYLEGVLPAEDMLAALYQDAGWTSYVANMKSSMKGIRNSSRIVTAWDDTTLVGMARTITDGHTIVYVQDILVMGTYRRRGIGKELMRKLLTPYKEVRQTVLITDDTPQTKLFYQACGFESIGEYQCVGFIRLK